MDRGEGIKLQVGNFWELLSKSEERYRMYSRKHKPCRLVDEIGATGLRWKLQTVSVDGTLINLATSIYLMGEP